MSIMSECASAVRARYELQVLHCQQQAERQARLISREPEVSHVAPPPKPAPAPVDLVCGYLAIGAAVGMSTATLMRRLQSGDVPVFRVSIGRGRPTFAIRRADLPMLRRNRAHPIPPQLAAVFGAGEVLQ